MKTSGVNRPPTALITGASSGIGYELAREFARHRYNLVLVARSAAKLADLANSLQTQFGVVATVLVKDLALPTAPQEIGAELQQAGIEVDVLVNNAGFGGYGAFADTDLTHELEMLQVNIVALTHLTKLVLPPMQARRSGKILNVASVAAFQPGPLMAVYYATKAYVLSFSEALGNELQGTGVTVTALCPGPTVTGFEAKANLQGSKLFKQALMDAETVAIAGYQALMQGKPIVIPGWKNRLLPLVVRLLPRQLVTRLVRQAQAAAPGTH
jgi:uncharacterized protein